MIFSVLYKLTSLLLLLKLLPLQSNLIFHGIPLETKRTG